MSAEEGYEFVPLPEKVSRSLPPHARLDRRVPGCLFGAIEVVFTSAQPVHVGSGFKVLRAGKVMRAMTRSAGALVIPGASFKGAVRARFEAATLSCVPHGLPAKQGVHAMRDISRSNPGTNEAHLSPALKRLDVFSQRCTLDAACPACLLFGFQAGKSGQRSRVTFTDLVPVGEVLAETGEVWPQWQPRLHHCAPQGGYQVRGDKIELTELKGRKFHLGKAAPPDQGTKQTIERLPYNRQVRGELRLFNVSPAELGGLLIALGFFPGHALKVGGGKSQEHGKLIPTSIEWRLKDHQGAPVAPAPGDYTAAFKKWEDGRFGDGANAMVKLFKRGDA